MSNDTPRPERVTLTDEEREHQLPRGALMTATPAEFAARIIEKNWRGIWPADARRMAVDLKRAGVLIPELPDVAQGLVIDDNGARVEDISCALGKRAVTVVVTDADSCALITLRPDECRALAGWLLAAAHRLMTPEEH